MQGKWNDELGQVDEAACNLCLEGYYCPEVRVFPFYFQQQSFSYRSNKRKILDSHLRLWVIVDRLDKTAQRCTRASPGTGVESVPSLEHPTKHHVLGDCAILATFVHLEPNPQSKISVELVSVDVNVWSVASCNDGVDGWDILFVARLF